MTRRRSCIRQEGFARAMTHEEIAQIEGVSKERIRQIETCAMAKLRTAARRQGLTVEDLLCLAAMEARTA